MSARCDWPVRLANADGEAIAARCGCTDAAQCRTCSKLHADDVRHLVEEGIGDGPATFVTVTAPGAARYGRVHSMRRDGSGRPRRCACGVVHGEDGGEIGTPIDPESFPYSAIVEWNAASRRLLTVMMQKLARLVGDKLEWVAVPELQARGLVHWHVVIRRVISASDVHTAISGGVNPRTGRRIAPAAHRGHVLGEQVDVQPVIGENGARKVGRYLAKYLAKACASLSGEVSARMEAHRRELARAVCRHMGSCACKAGEWSGTDRLTGREVRVRARRRHGSLPDSIRRRFAPWAYDRCPRRRRAIRQGGHVGRTLGRTRNWPLAMSDLADRRRVWVAGQGTPVQVEVSWRYSGRGYGETELTGFDVDELLAAAT